MGSEEDAGRHDRNDNQESALETRLTRARVLRLGAGSALAAGIGAMTAGRGFAAPETTDKTAPKYNLAKLVKAAQAEGELNFYSAMPPVAITALANAFTAQYGIKVNVTRQVSAQLATLVVAETNSGKHVGDIVQMSDYFFMIGASQHKWFRKPPANLPGLAKWPAKYTRGKGTVYLQSLGAYTVGYNTRLVQGSDIPTNWKKLLDPKWKGKLMTTDPRSNNNVLSFFYMLHEAFGDSFMRQLGAQDLKLTNSSVTGINSVASGDVAMLFPSNHWTDIALINQGAPIADAHPNPTPTSGAEEWFAMIKGAPHPNASLLFFNYAMSVAGQLATCKTLCTSVRNSKGTLGYPKGYQSPPINRAVQSKTKILKFLGLA